MGVTGFYVWVVPPGSWFGTAGLVLLLALLALSLIVPRLLRWPRGQDTGRHADPGGDV